MVSNKCAPNTKFENGSCIPLNLLKDISIAYNENNSNDKINLIDNDNKSKLLIELKKRLGEDEKKWINNSSIGRLSKDNFNILENKIFRPEGPQGKFEWLSTMDINKVLKQYENKYDDFKFLGAVPIDFMDLDYLKFNKLNFKDLENRNFKRFGTIFNLDESWKSGSHWVSLFFDVEKGQIYFSDSFATNPDHRIENFIDIIEKYMISKKKINKIDKKYNKTKHQKGNSECGVYSINFILRLLKGKTFDHITRKRLDDNKVNKCRLVYFK